MSLFGLLPLRTYFNRMKKLKELDTKIASKNVTDGQFLRAMNLRKTLSNVNHPSHYGGDTVYETIKVIEAWGLGFHIGNAVKYLSRAGKKDAAKELEDLKKAVWYINKQIGLIEAAKPSSK